MPEGVSIPPSPIRSGRYLFLSAAGERAAIEILAVKEILRLRALRTRAPRPVQASGQADLSGRIFRTLDLRILFGEDAATADECLCFLVEGTATGSALPCAGLLVDAVSGIARLDSADIERAPETGLNRPHWVVGSVAGPGPNILLLDIDRLLELTEPKRPTLLWAA